MKQSFSKILATSTIALIGAVGLSSSVYAQETHDVKFQGTVSSNCTITENVAQSPMTYYDQPGNYRIEHGFAGQQLTVNCNNNTVVSVGYPQADATNPSFTASTSDSWVYNATTFANTGDVTQAIMTMASNPGPIDNGTNVLAASTENILTINTRISSDSPLPAGTYNYTVPVTFTQQ